MPPLTSSPRTAADGHGRALPGLSPLQSHVMRVLWEQGGELTARQVHDRIPARQATVPGTAAALGSLCRAGLVARIRRGRMRYYRAQRSRDEHLASVIGDALAVAPGRGAVLRLTSPPDPGSEPERWHPTYPALRPGTGLDPGTPDPARVTDYLTGGKDNYHADRHAGDELLALYPGLAQSLRASRYFQARAIRCLAEAGVAQFLDIGCGLPTVDNTHEVAQAARPGATVVYADADPLVIAHARAILTGGPTGPVGHVTADLRDPADLIAAAAATLDFTQPAALLLVNVLQYIPDHAEARSIIQRLARALVPGSYLVICHPTAEVAGPAMRAATARWNQVGAVPAVLRTRTELNGLLGSLGVAEPGVVSCPRWHPDIPAIPGFAGPADVPHYCGVGRVTPRNDVKA